MSSVAETFTISLGRTNITPCSGYLSDMATPQKIITLPHSLFFIYKSDLYNALKGLHYEM